MANLVESKKLSLNKVAKYCGDVHVSTVHRWITRGVRGRKLPSVVIGGRRFVLLEELEAFLEKGREPQQSECAQEQHQSDRADAAKKELERIGF